MNTWLATFAIANPIMFFLVVLVAGWATVQPFRYGYLCFSRWMRSRNIQAQGWPKPPVDADGDILTEDVES